MVEEAENRCKISIWWDIENCHVPRGVDPHYVAQNLSSALHRAGLTGPIEIQAFGDTTILSHVTQKALSDTGITLNHVPRGNKDAADKAILVGMLLWALDNPPPANILLISGDGDFANALHRLRLKTYSILLARPAQFVTPALMGAAKKRWFWKEMAMGQLVEADLHQSNGDSSQGPTCPSGAFNKYRASSVVISNPAQYSSLPNGFTSPQKRVEVSQGENTTQMLRSLSLENQSRSQPMSMLCTESKSSKLQGNGPAEENKLSALDINAHQSRPLAILAPHSASHNMGSAHYPYIMPRAAENQQSSKSTPIIPGITSDLSKAPKFPPTQPVPMPNWPGTSIAPNNRGNNVLYPKSSPPHTYTIPTINIPPPNSQHTAPNRVSSSSENMSYDTSIDKVYSAMKTLERDMLVPTESNLYDCIQYWDPQHERIDLKQTLNRAVQSRKVTMNQLGAHKVMYFPSEQPIPWRCVDPGNMQLRYTNDMWLELQHFLLYGEKKQAFFAARSWYDAGQIVKSASGEHIKNLVMAQVLNLLQQAMDEKKWFRKSGPGVVPFVLNQKVVLDFSGDGVQKGVLTRSTSQ